MHYQHPEFDVVHTAQDCAGQESFNSREWAAPKSRLIEVCEIEFSPISLLLIFILVRN